MDKIEMFFGLTTKTGIMVTNYDFYKFLEKHVTSRFPDGLTVLDGFGQWKAKGSDQIIGEACKVLILVVETWQNVGIQDNVWQIRNAYCAAFQQESVLVAVSSLHEISF